MQGYPVNKVDIVRRRVGRHRSHTEQMAIPGDSDSAKAATRFAEIPFLGGHGLGELQKVGHKLQP